MLKVKEFPIRSMSKIVLFAEIVSEGDPNASVFAMPLFLVGGGSDEVARVSSETVVCKVWDCCS